MSKDISTALLNKLGGNYTPIYLFEFQKLDSSWVKYTNLDVDYTIRDSITSISGLRATFDHTQLGSSLTQYPIKVVIDTSSPGVPSGFFEGHTGTGDYKYLYAKAGTTQLYIDVERWDPSNGKAFLHVSEQTLILSSITDTVIDFYFDDEENDKCGLSGDTGIQNLYQGYFEGVWHFNQDPTTGYILDSTLHNRNGELYGSMELSDLITTSAGYGIDFNGVNQGASFGDYFDGQFGTSIAQSTFEFIINQDSFGDVTQNLFSKHYDTGEKGFQIRIFAKNVGFSSSSSSQSSSSTSSSSDSSSSTSESISGCQPDGTWTSYTIAESNTMLGIGYGSGPSGSGFVACSQDGTNRVQTSPDGETWTARSTSVAGYWSGVAYDTTRDRFIICSRRTGTTQKAMYSDDVGATWTAASDLNIAYRVVDICYSEDEDKVVVLTESGAARSISYYSTNGGVNWTAGTTTSSQFLLGICRSESLDLYVAVGANGIIYTSPDGSVWTSRTSGTSNNLEAVCWSESVSKFIAVGANSTTVYSSDGITWSTGTLPNNVTWNGVLDCNGKIIAVGDTNNVAASTNGTSFSSETAPANGSDWEDIANGSDMTVAIGSSLTYRAMKSECGSSSSSSSSTSNSSSSTSDSSSSSSTTPATYEARLDCLYQDKSGTFYRQIISSVALNQDQTYHIAVTYDATVDTNNGLDRVRFWIDGVEDTLKSIESSAGSLSDCDGNAAYSGVAATYDDIGTMIGSQYNGRIDELKISSTERSDDWIETDYLNYKQDLITFSSQTVSAADFENTTTASGTYSKRYFTIDDLNLTTGKIMQDCNLTIDNRDDVMTLLFMEDSLRDQQARIYYGVINDNNPGYLEHLILLFDGYIDSWNIDEEHLKLTIGSLFSRWNKKTYELHSTSCRWKKFKGTQCAYAGAGTSCDRSYKQCSAYSNTANFGGFRWLNSIEGKRIYFGPAPSEVK